ncbi:MAG: tripartite tricarboxylate transporter substrate binding protein [Zoogloeaceae bacterium]|jgi:tripartite-type tricarboxylate transporter receptor subunit TctC|nr:tripartite tricarboxylate transporter substrate binding protein [Zoogloeaceae bacterium]
MKTGIPLFVVLLAFGFLGLSQAARAEYPERPVKIIIPYPAGGIVDVATRIVTDRIAQNWGQPVLVENRPGANGNIGAATVKNAAPDGYTLLIGSTFLVLNPLLDRNSKVGSEDFVPIGTLGIPPNLLAVPAASPTKSLADFIVVAKAKPGQLNAANPGIGSSNHLGTEVFLSLAGIDLTQVNYKGQPPFIPDLLNGQLDFAFISAALAAPHIQSGKLRPLAVSYDKRLKSHPDLPTVGELGYPEAAVLPWTGFFAPTKTPPPIVRRLAAELKKALQDAEVMRRNDALEAVNPDLFLEDFAHFLDDETRRWRKVIAERHLQAE